MEIKKNENNYCVIMAGGIGVRFWPLSKTNHPKQFIDILGTGETLIRKTFRRFLRICPLSNIYIVTNEQYLGLVKEQIPELPESQILLEPARRNTAPCIAYANYKIQGKNPEAAVVVAPSDHIIIHEDEFLKDILIGLQAAEEHDWLLTLGIKPTRPDTGYGYIQFQDGVVYPQEKQLRKVKTFTEKPDRELAERFLATGEFLWNSGIFIWKLRSIQQAFSQFLPEVDDLFRSGIGKYDTPEEKAFILDTYTICRNISIDYGIMEKAENVYVLAADFGWSDLGTWGSLYEAREKDDHGNAIVGKNVLCYDTRQCIINMPKNKLVVIQGLEDYIVVEQDHVLLICKKADEQQLRQIVNDVKVEKGDKFV